MTSLRLLGVWRLVCAALGPAPAAAERCDRARRYETLQALEQQTLHRGAPGLTVQRYPDSAYHTGSVYHLVPYAPELVMAVFTSDADHPGQLTNILAATVEAHRGPYARVRFVYTLPWPLPNSAYVVNETVVHAQETYLLAWDLHPSSPRGMSVPQYAEGYVRTQPVGPHTLISYGNDIIPGTGLWPDTVNRDGLPARQTTMQETVRWVEAVAASSALSHRHLGRFRAMMGP